MLWLKLAAKVVFLVIPIFLGIAAAIVYVVVPKLGDAWMPLLFAAPPIALLIVNRLWPTRNP